MRKKNRKGFFRLGILLLGVFAPSTIFGSLYVAPRFQETFFPIPHFDFGAKRIVKHRLPKHVATPAHVRGIYVSSWVAGTPSVRTRIFDLLDKKDLNTVVIDVKDSLGQLSFMPNDPYLQSLGSGTNRIADLPELITELHKRRIYVIARISAFEDIYMAKRKPEWSVKRGDGKNWVNRKNEGWLDPGSKEVGEYLIAIGKEAYARGFDEINYDYIRFPSDGNMKDIVFPYSKDRDKPEVLEEFYAELQKAFAGTKVKISADFFGETTTSNTDLGIGQVLERALPYFDYISPMVYPSHYAADWRGYKNPAEFPYEVIKESMQGAIDKTLAASSTPSKLRPWLQDFSIGADYGPDKIRAQIKASDDLGLDGWLMWSASNRYTTEGYEDRKK